MDNDELLALDEEEYAYISERFEIMTPEDTKALPRYILKKRKNNMRRLVDLAIENELDELTGKCIKEKYYQQLPVMQIAKNHGIDRFQVRRITDRGEKKLFTVLKYVYLCGFSLVNPPANLEDLILELKTEEKYEDSKN